GVIENRRQNAATGPLNQRAQIEACIDALNVVVAHFRGKFPDLPQILGSHAADNLGRSPSKRIVLIPNDRAVGLGDFHEPAVYVVLQRSRPRGGANFADSAVGAVDERALSILEGPAATRKIALSSESSLNDIVTVVFKRLQRGSVPANLPQAIESVVGISKRSVAPVVQRDQITCRVELVYPGCLNETA